MVTSAGAPALQIYIPNEDASAVAKLRRAGAILLGKTNFPIFTSGFQAYNSNNGTQPDPHARSIEVIGKQRPYYGLMQWACLATGAGLPAAVAPVMLGPDGSPRGVQIIAERFEDRTAIACAAMLKTLGGASGHRRWSRLPRVAARLTSGVIAANVSCKSGGLG